MKKKRIVVKVGSSTITHESGRLNLRKLDLLARVLSDLNNAGHEVVLVSSGAIAAGCGKMQLHHRPKELKEKQAMAAIGQCELMYIYDQMFAQYSRKVAQLLLTKRDLEEEQLKENALNTLQVLLSYGTIPIINENDSIATEEIVYGDNDTLSAITAQLIQADLLVLLSDIEGLYDQDPSKNPNAKKIDVVDTIDEHVMAMAGDSNSNVGTGGMITKLHAAQIATSAGCNMVIANGEDPNILYDLVEEKNRGTLFCAKR